MKHMDAADVKRVREIVTELETIQTRLVAEGGRVRPATALEFGELDMETTCLHNAVTELKLVVM